MLLSNPRVYNTYFVSWWRHQMETFTALLAICARNSPVPGEFPTQRPVTRSFDVFFDLRLNKRLSKQWWGWWFETPASSLWRHCNDLSVYAKKCPDAFLGEFDQTGIAFVLLGHCNQIVYPRCVRFYFVVAICYVCPMQEYIANENLVRYVTLRWQPSNQNLVNYRARDTECIRVNDVWVYRYSDFQHSSHAFEYKRMNKRAVNNVPDFEYRSSSHRGPVT